MKDDFKLTSHRIGSLNSAIDLHVLLVVRGILNSGVWE